MKQVWIVGAGGLAKVYYDILRREKNVHILGFADDDDLGKKDKEYCGKPILVPISAMVEAAIDKPGTSFIVTIGETKTRHRLFTELKQHGLIPLNAVDRNANISPLAVLGAGVMVESGAGINPGAHIGDNVIISLNVSIGHDAVVADSVHLAHNVSLGGGSVLEDCVDMGLNSCVLPEKTIGKNSIIGAGAVVTTDIPPDVVAVGVPARVIKSRD